MTKAYLSDLPTNKWQGNYRRINVNKSAREGYSYLSRTDGLVISIQPDGSEQTRPAGTDAGYEQCQIVGNRAVYDYESLVQPVVYDIIVVK